MESEDAAEGQSGHSRAPESVRARRADLMLAHGGESGSVDRGHVITNQRGATGEVLPVFPVTGVQRHSPTLPSPGGGGGGTYPLRTSL